VRSGEDIGAREYPGIDLWSVGVANAKMRVMLGSLYERAKFFRVVDTIPVMVFSGCDGFVFGHDA
jgi:hypothetical protein